MNGDRLGSDYERFLTHVDTSGGTDACHPWTAYRNPGGYGMFRVGGKMPVASRWLLGELRGAPLTEDENALHHCDNPPCVNPWHLYVGTREQNARDCVNRHRHPGAEQTHCTRGHLFDAANTYYKPTGKRECRACKRQWQREFRAAGRRPSRAKAVL